MAANTKAAFLRLPALKDKTKGVFVAQVAYCVKTKECVFFLRSPHALPDNTRCHVHPAAHLAYVNIYVVGGKEHRYHF